MLQLDLGKCVPPRTRTASWFSKYLWICTQHATPYATVGTHGVGLDARNNFLNENLCVC